MSNLTRRGFFKIATITTASTLLASKEIENKSSKKLLPKNKKQSRVVVVGGGMGGVSVAESIKAVDKEDKIEVVILERNAQYFTCPMSNTLLGEIKEVEKEGITFYQDYTKVEKNHNIDVIITEVTGADVKSKTITTTNGVIDYDYVVVAVGIDYNYKKLFPTWDEEKVRRAMKETPAAMYSDSGKEKKNLLNQLHEWKDRGGKGNFIIVPPKGGKVRCKPASYERACMVSEYIKKHKLPGKVSILDNSPKPQSKGPKFIEVFIKHHKDTIIFNGMSGDEMHNRIKKAGFTMENFMKKKNFSKVEDLFATCNIKDVDFDKKSITYEYADNFDDEAKKKSITYEVANIIPYHKGNKTAEFFDVKRDKWGGIICKPYKTYSVTDSSVYVAGDIMGFHKFNPSAQAAVSFGLLTGENIANRVLNNKDEIDLTKAGITCFSMVVAKPLKAIEISKSVLIDDKGMAKPSASKLAFRDGTGLIGWYQAIVEGPFKY